MILIVIPTYNESAIIERTLDTLFRFLHHASIPHETFRVVVADNGSTDDTPTIVRNFMCHEAHVLLSLIEKKGKGHAIYSAWQEYCADINIFLDADLSTDLVALPVMIQAIQEGADIATASRFVPGAVVSRSLLRRCFSRSLRILLWVFFQLHVRDAPCGMKAVTRRVVTELVPDVRDRGWFFDTELLVRAERKGMRIIEVPVRWSDASDRDRPSRVSALRVIKNYCLAILRLRLSLCPPKFFSKRLEL